MAEDATKSGNAFRNAAVEMAGRNWLVAKLLDKGFQVSIPVVDHGIDLIVFDEVGERGIRALPLQLKCAREERFSLSTKYDGRGVVMTYIWNALDNPTVFMLTYEEALSALGRRANTPSWDKGHYTVTRVPSALRTLLENRYGDRWDWLRERLAEQPPSNVLAQP